MKNTLLICTGVSGSGKTYFVNERLPKDLFYKLKSATTRPQRKEEIGDEYFFVSELEFFKLKLATFLFVNEKFWKEGMPKWLYGVPEKEIFDNLGRNLIYDVIEPKYAKQLINWFKQNKLDKEYNIKLAYFVPLENNIDIVKGRANMPNDLEVRKINTCSINDFIDNDLDIDYLMRPYYMNPSLLKHIQKLQKSK